MITVTPDAQTDFWQRTHYGFRADNGWFQPMPAPDNFTLQVRVDVEPQHQYDQAGLMVRISPDCWLKTSVEFELAGPNRLGAVVTNGGYSDWSTQDFDRTIRTYWLRIERDGADYMIFSSLNGADWSQIRVAHLVETGDVQCGIYACSPKAAGLVAHFSDLVLTPR